jgi:hypothetical protein
MRPIPFFPMLSLGLAAVLAGPGARAEECRYEAAREARVDVAGAKVVRIRALAGSLRVVGQANLSQVEVEGRACAGRAEDLDGTQVRAERAGDTLRVEAELPEAGEGWGGSWWGHESPRLDLVVRVPAGMALDVDDTSGGIEIRDVGALEVRDRSGEIEVENVSGDIRLEDSSGDVRLHGVKGSVVVTDDGSGDLEIEDVTGGVRIDEDGSGSIRVSNVGGDVLVGRDGSGSIRVNGVGGDFRVDHDGSGGIDYRDVKGQVSIPKRRHD